MVLFRILSTVWYLQVCRNWQQLQKSFRNADLDNTSRVDFQQFKGRVRFSFSIIFTSTLCDQPFGVWFVICRYLMRASHEPDAQRAAVLVEETWFRTKWKRRVRACK